MNELLAHASARLRTSGGRMTTQRRLILQILDDIGGHPTAEEVYDAVHQRDTTINPSTVYRTLGWLAEAGLVGACRLGTERQSARKEQFDPGYPAEHHHFVCTNCGDVIEFESRYIAQAKDDFTRQYGATVERASLTLQGLCAQCRKASTASSESRMTERNTAWQ